jgi:hypothetical protein
VKNRGETILLTGFFEAQKKSARRLWAYQFCRWGRGFNQIAERVVPSENQIELKFPLPRLAESVQGRRKRQMYVHPGFPTK